MSEELDHKQLKEYKYYHGMRCPYPCNSRNLAWEDLEWTDSGSKGTVTCNNCGREWIEIHETVAVIML